MPSERGEMQAAVLDGRVHVPGGLEGMGESTDRHEVYDVEADEWVSAAAMPEPRNHHAVASVGGEVFAFGGNDNVLTDPPIDDVFAYDPEADEWTARGSMPDGRWGHESAVVDGTVYLVGGETDGDPEPAPTLAYDPVEDEWERWTPVPTQRDHLSVEAVGGEVIAAGGRGAGDAEPPFFEEPVDVVEVYDPEADAWSEREPMPESSSGMAAGVSGDDLYLAGGENPSAATGDTYDVHQAYSRSGDEWKLREPLPVESHGQASVVHGGRLYVVGGAERQGFTSPSSWTDRVFVYPAGG